MNTNTRYAHLVNDARVGTKPAFVEVGYGQVEPNHLSAQRTGQIYAQLPADENIAVLEQGQFVKYDYANEVCDFTGLGEWMLVFNEIKLYREGQNDCEFAMVKTDYNARIYSPYGGDKTEGRSLQTRYYNGVDAEGHDSYQMRAAVAATYKDEPTTVADADAFAAGTFYTKDGDTYTLATVYDNSATYYEQETPAVEAEIYPYDKVTSGTQDIYEMFQTEDPFHIIPGYEVKKMPEGTKMVPRVFKTNIGDIFTTNTIDETLTAQDVGEQLVPRDKDGILVKAGGSGDNTATSTMRWQIVKYYTMPDGQKGVKIMRIA